MPIDAKHTAYTAREKAWKRCRDVAAGQEAIQAAEREYLPSLKDQQGDEYTSYVTRALFFNATQRTIEGLTGMVFRKPPRIDCPEAMRSMLADVTMAGVPFAAFAESALEEVCKVGRYGILVDFPRVENSSATQAEAEAAGNRPFMVGYAAESIIDWKEQRIANRMMRTQIRLMETAEKVIDEFTTSEIPQIRVLDLLQGPGGWQYSVRLFQKREGPTINGADEWVQIGPPLVPLRDGQPLAEIPFVFAGVRDLTANVSKPPLLDMVETNLDHYRLMADYRHGLHFTGLPTPVISGYRSEPAESFYIGSTKAWVFPEPEAKASYLEFTGTGLSSLRDAIREDEERMAAQGARMLAPEKKATETAETAAIHRAGESSVLASMSISIGRALTEALKIMRDWAGLNGEVRCELNTDYFPLPMTPEKLTALVAAWMQGALSKEALFEQMRLGEVVGEDRTFEEEEAAIAASPPITMQLQEKLLEQPAPEKDEEAA